MVVNKKDKSVRTLAVLTLFFVSQESSFHETENLRGRCTCFTGEVYFIYLKRK